MKLSNTAEEILETLWVSFNEKGIKCISDATFDFEDKREAIAELIREGYIAVDKNMILLLPAGYDSARAAVRRHRLAECLLIDVVKMDKKQGNKSACEFEHILEPEMEEKICTMLGHPAQCPHGYPIPPGKCCTSSKRKGKSSIVRLSDMFEGQKGKIAYLYASNNRRLQKLMILGVLPGVNIKLLISKPCFVFQVQNTQIAIDRELASDIFVGVKAGK